MYASALLLALSLQDLSDCHDDLRRFPPHDVAMMNYLIADQHVLLMEKTLWTHTGFVKFNWGQFTDEEYHAAPLAFGSMERRTLICTLHEARMFREAWHCLVFARLRNEEKKERLRWLLGEANFAAGQMPPPVPWWRCRHAD